jgi:leucine dehydrogenase
MSVFEHPEFNGHEKVLYVSEPAVGLNAIIAIHNTHLGPALGGCRMYPYSNSSDALTDVLRLSRGMTYKSALAGLPLGGGKSVVIGDPRHQKTPELLRALGRAVDRLGGQYIIAEDSGTSPGDMHSIAQVTEHVAGIADNFHGGDPSPATAQGVFEGMKAGVEIGLQKKNLDGVTVALQGLGNVGFFLARLLTDAGAIVYGYDLHAPNLERAVEICGVIPVSQADILTMHVDVFSPCALGAILNAQTIASLNARVIAGAANNQLSSPNDDERLAERGIVYCPDFAINAGGIIDVFYQRTAGAAAIQNKALAAIGQTVRLILQTAMGAGIGSQRIAIRLAEQRLKARACLSPAPAGDHDQPVTSAA